MFWWPIVISHTPNKKSLIRPCISPLASVKVQVLQFEFAIVLENNWLVILAFSIA